jgi:hypothetical protein
VIGVNDANMDVKSNQDVNDTNKMKESMDTANDAVDNFLAVVRADNADDIIKATAQANNLFASLGNLNLDEMDLGDLLATADNLSALLRGLMGDTDMTKETARKLGANEKDLSLAARAARDLDEVLSRIDHHPKRLQAEPIIPSQQPPIDVTVISAPDHHFKKFDLSSVTKVEDVISGVAYEIHEKAKQLSGEADSVAVGMIRVK